ncbi:MAG: hypothetical protein K2N51_18570 [Lachnospiraceae bacterium]|nr:hypothetical protein [Lachnospiraceae bacterium]
MKLTNFVVINMINTLEKFSEKKFPQKISYAITRNLILLKSDYDCYIKSLNKLFVDYNDHMVRDKNNNVMNNDMGIPIVDNDVEKEFNEEISNLLNIEIELELYHIPENVFDYEDNTNRYDSLSAVDIMSLQGILCNQEGNENDNNEK